MTRRKFREEAWLVCQDSEGQLHKGNSVHGDRYSVSFPTHCPAGTKAVAVNHTHPLEASIRPSEADLYETTRRGIPTVCVQQEKRVRCYDVVVK